MCLAVGTKPRSVTVEMTVEEAKRYLDKEPTRAQVRLFLQKLRVAVEDSDRHENAWSQGYAVGVNQAKERQTWPL